MDFFDDEPAGRPDASAPPSRPRRRTDRRRTRIQRIVILAAILFVIVFGIAWWARSCQHNRKVDSYRTYFEGVSTAINDSDQLGKRLDRIIENPTRYSRKQLVAQLRALTNGQQEIAVRSDRLEAPGSLKAQEAQFATGMKIRAQGFALLETLVVSSLGKKTLKASRITALEGYFTGPDAYYMSLVYAPSRQVMRDDGVSDVTVPTSTYYLTSNTFDPTRLTSALTRVGTSSKLAGIHGVGLIGVTATTDSGDVKLVKGGTVDVPASAGLAFVVKVQNQGDVTETDVPVALTLVLPDKSTLKQSGSIATIAAGQTQAVTIQGFAIPSEALSKISTLKVKAGPVPEEHVLTNNSGEYKFLLQLK